MNEQPFNEWFAEAMERAIHRAGGVSDLAETAGVDQSSIHRWRKGMRPRPDKLNNLAYALGRADGHELLVRMGVRDHIIERQTYEDDDADLPVTYARARDALWSLPHAELVRLVEDAQAIIAAQEAVGESDG